MKKCKYTILLAIIFISNSIALSQENSNAFLTYEYNVGNYAGSEFIFTFKNNGSIVYNIGYKHLKQIPKSENQDISLDVRILYRLLYPMNKFQTFYFSLGKDLKIGKTNRNRLNLNLGIGYSIVSNLEPEHNNNGPIGYINWMKSSENGISFLIEPKYIMQISNSYLISISPKFQWNKEQIFIGIGFGNIFRLPNKNK